MLQVSPGLRVNSNLEKDSKLPEFRIRQKAPTESRLPASWIINPYIDTNFEFDFVECLQMTVVDRKNDDL